MTMKPFTYTYPPYEYQLSDTYYDGSKKIIDLYDAKIRFFNNPSK